MNLFLFYNSKVDIRFNIGDNGNAVYIDESKNEKICGEDAEVPTYFYFGNELNLPQIRYCKKTFHTIIEIEMI